MHIKFVQRLIDKIRHKNKASTYKIGEYDVEAFIIDGLKNVGFEIDKNSGIAVSKDGIKIDLNFEPYVAWEVFTKQIYEFLAENQKSVFIDIGMNQGFVSLMYAAKNWVEKIYSFEPFMPTYEKALENFTLNKHIANKIKAFPFGLSDKNESKEVSYTSQLSGCMSTSIDVFTESKLIQKYKNQSHTETVELKNASDVLTDIIEENKGKRIILKCDTEGAEFDIVKSMYNANLLRKIDIIFIEYHYKSPEFIENALISSGFVVFSKNMKIGSDLDIITAVNTRTRYE